MAFSPHDPDDAWRHFHQEYGQAMLAWQLLESELATLFSFLTKIPPAMAVKIYYAPRGFNGRLDVFKEAISVATIPPEARSLTRSLLKKASRYSEYRNKFAHDQPLLRQHGSGPGKGARFEIIMVDGKGQFQKDEEKTRYINDAVPVSEITYAAACFRQLTNLTSRFWIQIQSHGEMSLVRQQPWLETLQAQLLGIPNLPRQGGLFPPSGEPKSQPQASGE
jgi:hypothetical protein